MGNFQKSVLLMNGIQSYLSVLLPRSRLIHLLQSENGHIPDDAVCRRRYRCRCRNTQISTSNLHSVRLNYELLAPIRMKLNETIFSSLFLAYCCCFSFHFVLVELENNCVVGKHIQYFVSAKL